MRHAGARAEAVAGRGAAGKGRRGLALGENRSITSTRVLGGFGENRVLHCSEDSVGSGDRLNRKIINTFGWDFSLFPFRIGL